MRAEMAYHFQLMTASCKLVFAESGERGSDESQKLLVSCDERGREIRRAQRGRTRYTLHACMGQYAYGKIERRSTAAAAPDAAIPNPPPPRARARAHDHSWIIVAVSVAAL